MLTKRIFAFALMVFIAGGALMAQNFKYIGAAKCKMCHMKPATGEQYNIWAKGPHAGAMKTLASEESKKIATEMGIADPTTDAACIKCHATTGHIDSKLAAGLKVSEGVSCESCHGPGSAYKGASVMKNRELALTKGMFDPTEEVCLKCHNEESPTYVPFDFAARVAEIAHDDPTTE